MIYSYFVMYVSKDKIKVEMNPKLASKLCVEPTIIINKKNKNDMYHLKEMVKYLQTKQFDDMLVSINVVNVNEDGGK